MNGYTYWLISLETKQHIWIGFYQPIRFFLAFEVLQKYLGRQICGKATEVLINFLNYQVRKFFSFK